VDPAARDCRRPLARKVPHRALELVLGCEVDGLQLGAIGLRRVRAELNQQPHNRRAVTVWTVPPFNIIDAD
jgi:hypothetical protein